MQRTVTPDRDRPASCPDRSALARAIDGSQPGPEADAIGAHLAECPDCRARLGDATSVVRNYADPADDSSPDGPFGPQEDAALDRMKAAFEGESVRIPEFIGPYRVVRQVGRGGIGSVYEAIDPRLNRRVAIKTIRAELVTVDMLERLRREAEIQGGLNHPRIVVIHEVGGWSGLPYLVQEFIDGGTLADRLRCGPPTPRESARLIANLAGAVQYAHERGVIHRDLKPSNVLLGKAPSPPPTAADAAPDRLSLQNPKISDFGLARWSGADSDLTRTGTVIGTPAYMAPEQASGRTDAIGPATDIYALGVILYEMLTGSPPFQGGQIALTLRLIQEAEPIPPSVDHPDLPRDLETICLKCLEKLPHRRYATAADLADDLERFLLDRPIAARPVGALGRLARFGRRNVAVMTSLGVALACLLIVATGGVVFAWSQSELRNQAEDQRKLAVSEAARAKSAEAATLAERDLARGLFGEAINSLLYFSVELQGMEKGAGDSTKLRDLRVKCQSLQMRLCKGYVGKADPAQKPDDQMMWVLFQLGRIHADIGAPEESRDWYLKATEAGRTMMAARPESARICELNILSWNGLGCYHINRFDGRDDAIRAWAVGRDQAKDAARFHDDNATIQKARCDLLFNLSSILKLAGRKAEAEEVGRERAEILARIEAIEAEAKSAP